MKAGAHRIAALLVLLSPALPLGPAGAASAQGLKGDYHEDARFGFKVKPPKEWKGIPVPTGQSWVVGKYLSEKKYFYTEKGSYTYEFQPEMTIVAFVSEELKKAARQQTLDEAADDLWAISTGFGPHTREQWLALTDPQLRRDGDWLKPRCDPAIAVPFKAITPQMAAAGEAMLWQSYDRLTCPTLLLRGAESDLLSPATARAMTERGPRAQLVEFAGVGHAPMLVQPDQVEVVRNFLLSP